MFNFYCKILQHPKINPGSAPGGRLGGIYSSKSTFQNLNSESIDELGKVIS